MLQGRGALGASCWPWSPLSRRTNLDLKKVRRLLSKRVELLSCFLPFNPSARTLEIPRMSSLPPVYIVSAARTPTGMFLGYVFK